MKTRHGECIDLVWPCYPLWFAVRGHVTREDALGAVRRAEGSDVGLAASVRHTWAFWSFPSAGTAEGVDRELVLRGAPGRGRFPVTVIDTEFKPGA